jgi:AcrR family transcriptional regulator
MGVKERREREKSEMRASILDAARAMLLREGYESVSMRKLAEAIEYSPAAIYAYFPDKESLFREMCREDFGRLSSEFLELAELEDPVQRIREAGRVYIRFAAEFPNHYRLMFMTSHPPEIQPDETDLQTMGDPEKDGFAFLKSSVVQAIQRGCFRPELTDSDLIAQVLWAGVHGVASLQITHKDDPWIDWRPLDERSRLMVDSLLRGMLRNPGELS